MKKMITAILIIAAFSVISLAIVVPNPVTATWLEGQLPAGSTVLTGPDANGYWVVLISNSPPPGDDLTGYWTIKPLSFNNQFIGFEKFPAKNPLELPTKSAPTEKQMLRWLCKSFSRLFKIDLPKWWE